MTWRAIHEHHVPAGRRAGVATSPVFSTAPTCLTNGCDCRKPATGLLRAIEAELGGAGRRHATFIGDSLKDLQAGRAMGCKPVLVLTGKGEKKPGCS